MIDSMISGRGSCVDDSIICIWMKLSTWQLTIHFVYNNNNNLFYLKSCQGTQGHCTKKVSKFTKIFIKTQSIVADCVGSGHRLQKGLHRVTWLKTKQTCVSDIVLGAGPNVEVGRNRPAGRSLGTPDPHQCHSVCVGLHDDHQSQRPRIDQLACLKPLHGVICCLFALRLYFRMFSRSVPLDWQTGGVVPLFRKGDQRVCSLAGNHTPHPIPGYWRGKSVW